LCSNNNRKAVSLYSKASSMLRPCKSNLPMHSAIKKDLFIASIIDLYTGDKSLQTCDSNAVISEALKAAVLNLPINKALGFAYIVVYNNNVKTTDPKTGRDVWTKVPTPTFILGYKGYIQLASRTGQYRTNQRHNDL